MQWESFEAWIIAEDKDVNCVTQLCNLISHMYEIYVNTDESNDEATMAEKMNKLLDETEIGTSSGSDIVEETL